MPPERLVTITDEEFAWLQKQRIEAVARHAEVVAKRDELAQIAEQPKKRLDTYGSKPAERHEMARASVLVVADMLDAPHPSLPRVRAELAFALEILR